MYQILFINYWILNTSNFVKYYIIQVCWMEKICIIYYIFVISMYSINLCCEFIIINLYHKILNVSKNVKSVSVFECPTFVPRECNPNKLFNMKFDRKYEINRRKCNRIELNRTRTCYRFRTKNDFGGDENFIKDTASWMKELQKF